MGISNYVSKLILNFKTMSVAEFLGWLRSCVHSSLLRIPKLVRGHFYTFLVGNRINKRLGQIYYGNDSGFWANWIGLRFINRRGVNDLDGQTKKLVQTYFSLGWLKLDGAISTKTIDLLNLEEKLPEIHEKYRYFAGDTSSGGKKNFYNKYPQSVVSDFISDEIDLLLKAIYQSNYKVMSTYVYRISWIHDDLMDSKREFFNENWHCDGSTVDCLKIFVALSDISESSGPMFFLDRKETALAVEGGFSRKEDGKPGGKIDQTRVINKTVAKAGDVFIVNSNWCMHRASVPEKGEVRDFLRFYVRSSKKSWSRSEMKDSSTESTPYFLGRFFKP